MPDTQQSIDNEGLPTISFTITPETTSLAFEVSPSQTVQAPVDATLTISGKAADAKATGDQIRSIKPATDGTSGQLLRTNGDGTTQWVSQGLPTDAQTAEAVTAWLNVHPEATTTVQDGSITEAKLNSLLIAEIVPVFTDDGEGNITMTVGLGE